MAAGPAPGMVAQRLHLKPRGFLRKRAIVAVPPGMAGPFLCRELADGSFYVDGWREGDDVDDARGFLLAISKLPIPLPIEFPDLRSRDGHRLTLRFSLVVRAAPPERFIEAFGPRRIADRSPLATRALASFVMDRTNAEVAQRIGGWSVHDLKSRGAVTPRGWIELLEDALSDPVSGSAPMLRIESLDDLIYESAEAEADFVRERREAERKLKLAEEQRAIEYERDLALLAEKRRDLGRLKEEAARSREDEAELDALERLARRKAREEAVRIQEAETEQQATQAELRRKIEWERLLSEFATQQAARIDAENARLRAEKLGERLNEVAAEQEAEAAALRAEIETARASLARISAEVAELHRYRDQQRAIRQAGIPDPRGAALQHAGLGADALHRIDAPPRHLLSALVHQRQNASPQVLTIERPKLLARDLGIVRLDTIEIGAPFQMLVRAAHVGWLTLINIGTSGKATLLAPNNLAGLAGSRLGAGVVEEMPGDRLLPGARLRELGPPGSQELVAMLTDAPLFGEADIAAVAAGNYILPEQRIGEILERLHGLPEDAWYGAVLPVSVVASAGRQ